MENINGFDFFRLHFDADGHLEQPAEWEDFKRAASQAMDAVFIAHGFRNDESDATGQYTQFLENLGMHIGGPFQSSLGPRRFVVAGVYWPSKQFPEEVKFDGSTAGIEDETGEKEQARAKLIELRDTVARDDQKPALNRSLALLDQVKGNPQKQNEFVENVLKLLDGSELDATEGLDQVRSKHGSELLDALSTPIRNPIAPTDDSEGGAAGVGDVFVPPGDGGTQSIGSFFGSVFGCIGQFLNLTTWYVMKDRSVVVGANGVAKAVRELKAEAKGIKIHLVGHSLGGRLMAACAKSLAQDPKVQLDSLTLLEAAFSHFGFSANNGQGVAGFFREVVDKQVVKGPFVVTFSAQDNVVGTIYAIASRLAGQNTNAIGDANDPYGGIGRNGAQKTAEAAPPEQLHATGAAYNFPASRILCLDGSGGLIKDHGDVTNPDVTYAFASAVAAS